MATDLKEGDEQIVSANKKKRQDNCSHHSNWIRTLPDSLDATNRLRTTKSGIQKTRRPGIIAVQSSRRKAWALPAQSTDHVVKVKVVDVHVFEICEAGDVRLLEAAVLEVTSSSTAVPC